MLFRNFRFCYICVTNLDLSVSRTCEIVFTQINTVTLTLTPSVSGDTRPPCTVDRITGRISLMISIYNTEQQFHKSSFCHNSNCDRPVLLYATPSLVFWLAFGLPAIMLRIRDARGGLSSRTRRPRIIIVAKCCFHNLSQSCINTRGFPAKINSIPAVFPHASVPSPQYFPQLLYPFPRES